MSCKCPLLHRLSLQRALESRIDAMYASALWCIELAGKHAVVPRKARRE